MDYFLWYNFDMGKKINVERLIKEATHHKFVFNEETEQVEDNLAELLDETTDDTFYYVGISDFVISYFKTYLDTEWNIRAIFQIGFPYSYPASGIIDENNIPRRVPVTHPGYKIREYLKDKVWNLFVFTKKKFDKTIIGFNNYNSCKLAYKPDDSSDTFVFFVSDENEFGKPVYDRSFSFVTGRLISRYVDYYKTIQKILEKGYLIERRIDFETFRDIDFEFVEVPSDSLYIEYLNFLYRYKESVTNLFGYPTDEEVIKPLSNEVDFINHIKEIKTGDILLNYFSLNRSEKKYAIRSSIAEKDQSKAKCECIMRSKDLSPFYILSYLQSDFLKEFVLTSYKPVYEDFEKTIDEHKESGDELEFFRSQYFFNLHHDNDEDWEDLDIHNIPIIVNHSVDTNYFEKKYQWEKQQKLTIQRKLEKQSKTLMYNTNAKDIILRDMKELKECFHRGTYKAAIIMAGSILEAFLIDWLSEINDTNYFEEDYLVFDSYRQRYRRADLKDYISVIAELKKPNWFDAAAKATEIRKKRNLVHAKLYINDNDISRETCTEVINFLEAVINTRWQ